MDKTQMPKNISYTLLVHGGSYKSFLGKMARDLEGLDIVNVKKKSVHYYIIQVTENGKVEYKKDDIYNLPIMAMREEFSNYLFFKSVKTYNNALKHMCDGDKNKNAPYDLYKEMLTGIEKYKLMDITDNNKSLIYETEDERQQKTLTKSYGSNIKSLSTINNLFNAISVKLDDEEIDYIELLKKQNLLIGIH